MDMAYKRFISILWISLDVNECEVYDSLCALNATCSNTIGSYQCNCDTGFTGDGSFCSELNHIVFMIFSNRYI